MKTFILSVQNSILKMAFLQKVSFCILTSKNTGLFSTSRRKKIVFAIASKIFSIFSPGKNIHLNLPSKKASFLILISFLHIGILNCGDETGEFGFATTYDQQKTVLELDLAKATDYKMMREKIIFSPRDTIHYVYKFAKNPLAPYGANDEFSVSLEKESLGFVEIDLKKKYMNSENNALQDKFKNLDIGHYVMKISFDGEIIDSVYFDVVPDEGYALDESEENSIDNQKDEIVRYSK